MNCDTEVTCVLRINGVLDRGVARCMHRWSAPANHAKSGHTPSRSRVMVDARASVGVLTKGGVIFSTEVLFSRPKNGTEFTPASVYALN